jgi:hypothetical protein
MRYWQLSESPTVDVMIIEIRYSSRRVEVCVQAHGWNPESGDLSSYALKLYVLWAGVKTGVMPEVVWDAWGFVLKQPWEAVEVVNPRLQ